MKKRYLLGIGLGVVSATVAGVLAYRNSKSKDRVTNKAIQDHDEDELVEVEVEADDEKLVERAVSKYYAEISSNYKISEQELLRKVDANEDCVIVDIRNEDYYTLNHIKGAVNIVWPYDIANKLYYLPQDKPVYVYCYTGQTSGQTIALLRVLGFDAYSINMGMVGLKALDNIDDYLTDKVNILKDLPGTCLNVSLLRLVTKYYDDLVEVETTKFANNKVSETDFKEMLNNGDDYCLLSIRSAEDFVNSHIEGALNIPFGKNMDEKFNILPKDKKIVVYCYTGQTAGQTVATLRLLGYDAVSLNGGYGTSANVPNGWFNQGFEVVS